jgi:dienelactone hydrolase
MSRTSTHSRRRFLTGAGAAVLSAFSASWLRSEDGALAPTIQERLQREIADAPLSLRFRGESAEECRKWQAEFAAQLRSLLGPHKPPDKWKTVVQSTADLADHRREELLLTADGHPSLPIYLLLPREKSDKKRAGALALHGHGAYGHHAVAGRDDLPGVAKNIKSANYDYGRQLVQRGYVVAVPCFTPFGDRLHKRDDLSKTDACGDTFIRMQMLGKLLIAENLRDSLWALELLARHEQVDAGRLGCVGLSYGGRMTMLTAAVEPRIRVAVVSGALNLMQERVGKPYGCGAQIIPGLLKYGDTPEISSLIAPRHCLWEAGSRDSLSNGPESEEFLSRLRRAYKALGAEDQLQVDRFEGGHVWHGAVAYGLLEKVLI